MSEIKPVVHPQGSLSWPPGHALWPLLLRLLTMLVALSATQTFARQCTSDFECRRLLPLGGNARCSGDTLVTTTTRCVAGRCQTRETSRRNCRTTTAPGRCTGGYFQRTSSRCDALAGRCVTRRDREPCRRGCSCRGTTLVVYTGACSPVIGCHRAVRRCPGGCGCDPEPVCRNAPDDVPPEAVSRDVPPPAKAPAK